MSRTTSRCWRSTSPEPDDIALTIGHLIADLISDGSTIQAGIGTIPNAVLKCLTEKKNLGVHTEMFSDGLVDLFQSGAITNLEKTHHKGKVIASFCMGTKRLYDFIDNNPLIEFHPSDYVNDPFTIARHQKMVAINSALQVDLSGQVCSDSIGYAFYSGLGGQVDFMRGSARSVGGKPIIALSSRTEDGKHSRIVPHLNEGAGVVTSRGDVHYVVTEYGVAYLHGKSVRERATALISIAHPDFRDELLEHAKRVNYVYQDQISLNLTARYPKELEEKITIDDVEMLLRPTKPTDENTLRQLFYAASKRTKYYRFHGQLQTMRHRDAQYYCNIDYENVMVIAAVIQEEDHEKIIAIGQYDLNPGTNIAECAFMVLDEYQNKKVGSQPPSQTNRHRQEQGYRGFQRRGTRRQPGNGARLQQDRLHRPQPHRGRRPPHRVYVP